MHSDQWVERVFQLGEMPLENVQVLHNAQLRYLQRGVPNAPADNIVLLPGYYGGAMAGNLPLAAADSPLADPRWCLIIPGMLGGGESSSPSNQPGAQSGAGFPPLQLIDQVRAQRRLLDALFGNVSLALVAGWSLGGMQSLQWGCLYPQQVRRVAAWCSGVRCHPHNLLFLLGLRAALQADPAWRDGVPEAGLRAFARVYASRAYAPGFVSRQAYRELGHASLDQLLQAWEQDHLAMQAHDLLCVLALWEQADISANSVFHGDLPAALGQLRMPTLVMPCTSDQYFIAEEAEADARLIPGARFRLLHSDWGHCAGGPGREPQAMQQLWQALDELLAL